MDNPVYDFLTTVLTIIGYEDDKEHFVNQFMMLCIQEANAAAFATLPLDVQKQLDAHVKKNEAHVVGEMLVKHITKDTYEEHLSLQIQTNFEDYIETIIPTLDKQKKNTLLDFLSDPDKQLIAS